MSLIIYILNKIQIYYIKLFDIKREKLFLKTSDYMYNGEI